MTYIELMLWKLFAIVVIAFVWGLLCGLTGRDLRGRKVR